MAREMGKCRGRGDGNGRRKILNRTASPPLVRLLAQFECAGAYIIPVDRTILLSAQSQHNSHTRILPAWPEAASVASVASESDSEPGQKPDQSQTKPGGQSSEPRFSEPQKKPASLSSGRFVRRSCPGQVSLPNEFLKVRAINVLVKSSGA